jgi:hypothetical protein
MSSKPVVIKLDCDSRETKTNHVNQNWVIYWKFTKKTCSQKNITIIKISDHLNIGSDYRYFKLIIRLTILIIDYRTALASSKNWHMTLVLGFRGSCTKAHKPKYVQIIVKFRFDKVMVCWFKQIDLHNIQRVKQPETGDHMCRQNDSLGIL